MLREEVLDDARLVGNKIGDMLVEVGDLPDALKPLYEMARGGGPAGNLGARADFDQLLDEFTRWIGYGIKDSLAGDPGRSLEM